MVEILSRWQFGLTVGFHFLFVPLSIGMIFLVVIFEAMNLKTKNAKYKKISNFFGDIFVINYAFGIVTGITMSLQFGTNWSEYSKFMGDVFGGPLVLEALIAFFLESTFTGIWIFKKNKISDKMRLLVVTMIFIGTNISALWIITANGFMQNPVGYEIVGNKAVMTDIGALIFNPYAWYMLIHTNVSTFILGAMVVVSVSSYKFLRCKDQVEREIFKLAAKIGLIVLLVTSLLEPIIGNLYYAYLAPLQPTKIDAISGDSPNVFIAFTVMVASGIILILIAIYGLIFFKKFYESPATQKIFMKLFFIPYVAITAGWIVAEMGRQPWVVYGILTTEAAHSNVPLGSVIFSLVSIVILYTILGVACYTLTMNRIKRPLDYKGGGES